MKIINLTRKYTKTILLATTLALVTTVASCAGSRESESTGEYFDDSVITTSVKAAILNNKELKVAEINVETFKGIVQLSGFVSSQSDINTAINVARNVKGVKSVKDDMQVK